ncbi:CCR4-NOT regulatory complex component [Boothiomyces sp. JEL0866]|nr:CCR4-NOT regulatory complex component [Boothiomyces sp. JEL0866]
MEAFPTIAQLSPAPGLSAVTHLAVEICSCIQNNKSNKRLLASLNNKLVHLLTVLNHECLQKEFNDDMAVHLKSLETFLESIYQWTMKQQQKSALKQFLLASNIKEKVQVFEYDLQLYVQTFSPQVQINSQASNSGTKVDPDSLEKESCSDKPCGVNLDGVDSRKVHSSDIHLRSVTQSMGIAKYENTTDTNTEFTINFANSQLNGFLNSSIGHLINMTSLILSNNALTDSIPADLGKLESLQVLCLGNNKLTGNIPKELGNLSKLKVLKLDHNELTGEIPSKFGKLAMLTDLILHKNSLSGRIPEQIGSLTNLTSLSLNNNLLIGSIPSSIGKLKSLKILHCHDNMLFGKLPKEISNLVQLTSLKVGNNKLQGGIPKEIGSLFQLTELAINNTTLTGPIPKELSKLSNLVDLKLNNGKLSGNIPVELSQLSKLKILDLAHNQLDGTIPDEIAAIKSLQQLKLNNNGLVGTIPAVFSSQLLVLRLEYNHLNGKMPVSLGNNTRLVALCLEANLLNGGIPKEFGNLKNLKILNLNHNNLGGPVPMELSKLPKLERLTLLETDLTDVPEPLKQLVETSNRHCKKTKIPCVLRRGGRLQTVTPISMQNALSVADLNYDFGGPPILKNINLDLKRGSRCLLVGANGAGKSTLLRIVGGKNLTKQPVLALGKDVFRDGDTGITYLGTEWANNPIVRRDVPVSRLLKTLGAERNKERCAELLEIMDVDPDWHMHAVSDGQRRRVQIVLGLMEPWDLLLLDEVTVDLDILVRADLLAFLKRETEARGATILYATHIFDGLGEWPTHVAHIAEGHIDIVRDLNDFPEMTEAMATKQSFSALHNSPLLLVVEKWLRKDYKSIAEKKRKNQDGKPMTRWEILSENMKEYETKKEGSPLANQAFGSGLKYKYWTNFGVSTMQFLFALLPVAQAVNSSCQPIANDCSFYLNCVEPTYPCGPSGYAIGYGHRFCQAFKDGESQYTPKGQEWLKSVMMCLQQQLVPLVQGDMSFQSCDAMRQYAYGTHPYCYTLPGETICEISPLDWARLLVTIRSELLDPATYKQAAAVAVSCGEDYARLVAKAGEGLLDDLLNFL